jgi:hypothetical protein
MDWVWRALAPDLPTLGADGVSVRETPDGREVRVRCVVCSPADVELHLPRSSWAPSLELGSNGSGAAGVQPPLLAAVEAAGAPPLGRLSYSSLESYRRCSYRFYLERVARLGLKAADLADAAGEPVPEGLDKLLRGTVVHELMEHFDFARPRPPEPSDVEELLQMHGTAFEPADVEDIRRLIENFARSELCARRRACAASSASPSRCARTAPRARACSSTAWSTPTRQVGGRIRPSSWITRATPPKGSTWKRHATRNTAPSG